MLGWFAGAGLAVIAVLLVARWVDRSPAAEPRFEALTRMACDHCGTDAECYRPTVREVRSIVGALAWALPVALVASRFRLVDATWERPSLCRLHYSLARAALESALAGEALELARYLEGRASRLVSFQAAVLSRMLRKTRSDTKELSS